MSARKASRPPFRVRACASAPFAALVRFIHLRPARSPCPLLRGHIVGRTLCFGFQTAFWATPSWRVNSMTRCRAGLRRRMPGQESGRERELGASERHPGREPDRVLAAMAWTQSPGIHAVPAPVEGSASEVTRPARLDAPARPSPTGEHVFLQLCQPIAEGPLGAVSPSMGSGSL